MRAGALRRVGTLQKRTTSRDQYGGPVLTWENLGTIRYGVETQQGRVMDAGGNYRAVAQVTITMRYRPDITTQTVAALRIKSEDGRYYEITSVNDVNLKHHELELGVTEITIAPTP